MKHLYECEYKFSPAILLVTDEYVIVTTKHYIVCFDVTKEGGENIIKGVMGSCRERKEIDVKENIKLITMSNEIESRVKDRMTPTYRAIIELLRVGIDVIADSRIFYDSGKYYHGYNVLC